MSFYKDYIEERTTDHVIETDDGFALYRFLDGGVCYIVDIYTRPGCRQVGAAGLIADQIVKEARDKGCHELLGTVKPSAKGSTISLKVLLGYGMTLKSAGDDFIIFRKDIC